MSEEFKNHCRSVWSEENAVMPTMPEICQMLVFLMKEDTPHLSEQVIRTKNTASDKDLQIVQPADLDGMLRQLPHCRAVLTAGQLATKVFSEHFGIKEKPEMGGYAEFQFEGRRLRLYRMPSSSRAYPMAVEKKAEFYRKMFDEIL
jgi:G:T/U-mismatch repair DNA glycosylase